MMGIVFFDTPVNPTGARHRSKREQAKQDTERHGNAPEVVWDTRKAAEPSQVTVHKSLSSDQFSISDS